jgi:hypothetical protein
MVCSNADSINYRDIVKLIEKREEKVGEGQKCGRFQTNRIMSDSLGLQLSAKAKMHCDRGLLGREAKN